MTIKSSGSLSFTEITNEFGTANPTSLSQYYGLDAGIPTSGQIRFSDFYGKILNATRTINANQQNFNAYNDFPNATIVGGHRTVATVISTNQAVKYFLTNNAIIGSTSTGTTAFTTGSWPTGTSIRLTNNNFIVGAGGNGGNANSGAGGNGGNALTVLISTIITNNGTIAGGGGGGGAGAGSVFTQCVQVGCCQQECYTASANGGGGGGGAGSSAGSGGGGASNGGDGNLTTGGSGGGGGSNTNGAASVTASPGAPGGNLGQSGGVGNTGNGGSAGNYIVNNGNATFATSGTLLGGVG